MSPTAGACAAGVAAALAVALSAPAPPGERLARIVGTPRPSAGASQGRLAPGGRRRPTVAAAALCGVVVAVLVGGVAGLVVGAFAGGVLGRWLRRIEKRPDAERAAAARRELPLAADLLAGCLAGGAPPSRAVVAVAAALGPPLSVVLGPVAGQLSLGTDPSVAWASAVAQPGLGEVVRPLARVVGRSGTGARAAPALHRLACELREQAGAEASVRAQAVGVRAAGPLGLCFLPAFVLLGVVPSAVGLLASTWAPT
jgi:Flp pilus assembly protein TadB